MIGETVTINDSKSFYDQKQGKISAVHEIGNVIVYSVVVGNDTCFVREENVSFFP